MLAILYLALCATFGMAFVGLAVPDVRRLYIACSTSAKSIKHIPNTLFTVPAGIVTGLMCVPFFNYYVTLGLSYLIDNGELCKKLGVLITFAFFLWMILTCLILINRKRIKREELKATGATAIEDYKSNIADALFYGIVILALTITATFLMFYTYRIDGNLLLNGSSTFSDLSPHTAMVSSFGKGFNFPTQYMHYSGDGIKYHFLFYFLCGTLEYLGLPIDYALNLPSIITMVCALILLGLLAVLLSSRRASFLVAPVLVFLRSSLNVFYHLKELISSGSTPVQAVSAILKTDYWYAVTDYDNWGIWAINVYPNQRHLMLGIAVILIVLILFVPFVRRLGISISRSDGFGGGVKAFAFSKNAWLVRSNDPLYPVSSTVLACTLVIVMPYFHGSCLIAMLLVLFGMAIFSESRLLYLAVAVCAVVSSYVQTLVFSGGYQNVVSFVFEPGFILGKVTPVTLIKYLIVVTGATLVLAFIFAVISLVLDLIHKKPIHRFLLFICFLNPLIFAFIFRMSLEMLANHKFIQITLILADIFVAGLIGNLLYIPVKRRKASAGDEQVSEENDIIDAEADDGEIAVATAADSKGIRTPDLAVASAFGEPMPDTEETATISAPDIEATDAHTGVDADIVTISGLEPDTLSSKEPEAEAEKATEVKTEEATEENDKEEVEEDKPEELVFGDDKKKAEGEEDEVDEDDEAKAGVAAIAALFGEELEVEDAFADVADTESKDTEENTEVKTETEASETTDAPADTAATEEAKTEDTSEGDKPAEDTASEADTAAAEGDAADTVADTADDADDEDDAVMAAAPEPAHISMRPGSMALASVKFGEEGDDTADANVAIETAEEDNGLVAAAASDDKAEDIPADALKHEPVKAKKDKGISFAAWIALELAGILLAVFLMIPLTATGVSEWATYVNLNKYPLSVNINSPVTKWIIENTDPSDVFLTPEWSMNRYILAGRPMYYGWPYYAWSAGHDTYTRDTIYLWLITGCGGDINEFTRYCKERGIKYLIADSEFEATDFGNGITFNREFFEDNLTQAAYFAEENTTIYKIY